MAIAVLRRNAGQIKPRGRVLVNWGHPLAQGLDLCLQMVAPAVRQDDLSGNHGVTLTSNTSITPRVTDIGESIKNTGTGTVRYTIAPVIPLLGNVNRHGFTVEWKVRAASLPAGAYGTLLSEASSSGFWLVDGKLNFYSAGTHFSAGVVTVGRWAHLVCTITPGGALSYYVDGRLDANTYSGLGWPTSLDSVFSDSGGEYFPGEIAWLRTWRRSLTPTDVQWLANEPHAFLAAAPRVRYFAPTAATGPSITPTAVAAALTGVAPSRILGTLLTPVTP